MTQEFDAAVSATLNTEKAESARIGFVLAHDTNPDAYAEAQRVSRRTGLPVDTVLSNPKDVAKQARAGEVDFGGLAQTAPSTAALLADMEKARIAHDDVENLERIETALSKGRALRGTIGGPVVYSPMSREQTAIGDRRAAYGMIGGPAYRAPSGDLRPISRSILEGLYEPVVRGVRSGERGMSLMIDQSGVLSGLDQQQQEQADFSGVYRNPRNELSVLLGNQQRKMDAMPIPQDIERGMAKISQADSLGSALSAVVRNPRAVFETTLQSLGASAPSMLGGIVGSTAGPWGTAAGAGAGSFAVEYGSTLQDAMNDAGVDPSDPMAIRAALDNPALMEAARTKATKRGIPVALFDAMTAGVAGLLLRGVKPTAVSVGGRMAGEGVLQAGGGAAGEATAQAVTGEYKPGDILMEAVAEMPHAVIEAPSNYRHYMANAERAQQAEQTAQYIAALGEFAKASKVLARAPETFQQFVEAATENGPANQVYIGAQALMQSGVAEQVAAVSPAVAAQLQEAAATGGNIAIPTDEYLTRIAPTDMSAALLDHVKFDPEGFSRAEAQQYMQSGAGEELRAITERVLSAGADQEFATGRDAVKAQILDALNRAGRFSPEKNETDAMIAASYAAVRAHQLGMTPEQFFSEHMLSAQGESVLGGRVLNQGAPESPEGFTLSGVRQQWADAGIKHAISERDGTITLSQIVVPASERGMGKGTAAMQSLVGYADRTGQRIVLSPSSDFGGSKNRLVKFYKRFGFVENKGRSKDFTTMESMIRDPQLLRQSARGAFDPNTLTITLLSGADLSTTVHEMSHYFFETDITVAQVLAARLRAGETLTHGEQQVVHDVSLLLAWNGIQGDIGAQIDQWAAMDFEERRAAHERVAESFEHYMFSGRAPSFELAPYFRRIRDWMVSVYRSVKDFLTQHPEAGKLNDEVSAVFDRMLATEEDIAIAEQGRSLMPLFENQAASGMTPEEYAAYQELGSDATRAAVEELQARGLRDMKWLGNAKDKALKRLQRDANEARAEAMIDARREVMSKPIYQAWQFLTGKPTDDGEPTGKIRIADIAGDEAEWQRLRDFKMLSKDGLPADMVAEMFGFSSGDELVRALVSVPAPKDAIESVTDGMMLERHADLATPEAINRAADAAIHNEVRAKMVATEEAALSKAAGKPRVLQSAAKEFAAAMIDRLKIRAIRPSQYATAAQRAAAASAKANRSGDIATAAAEKRNQLIQHYATRAAYDAQDEVTSGLRYLRKFDGDVKGLDADYADQIGALLERFDLHQRSNKSIDRSMGLRQFLDQKEKEGIAPDIPQNLIDEAYRTPYKNMTVTEFRGLVDAVKQLEHLGRLKERLLTAKAQRTYAAARDEIVSGIESNSRGREANTRTQTDYAGRVASGLKRFWAAHIKTATWARVMDGGKDGGAVWEYLIRPANERGDMETTMRAEATAALTKIMAPVLAQGKMSKKQFFPSIKKSLSREARIAIALNTGNEGNMQRLLGGERGWTIEKIAPVLQSLTDAEWQAVQGVWDHFESYRPLIAEKERRVYGREPEWIEPRPFVVTTADGKQRQMRGGYYPIKYDPAASQRAEEHADAEGAKRQLQGAYTSATTRRSFTKSRSEEVVGRPLLYSLSGIYSGVNDVIHDLAWHEWLIDTNRFMRSQTIDAAIREHYGPEVKQQFKSWIADIAEGDKGSDGAVDMALSYLRQSVSVSGLGFNVMSALIQPLGITQSIVRVGTPWVARGVSKYIANPIALTKRVNSMSSFMENRARTRFRELNELRNQVDGQNKIKESVGRYAYFLMMRCQQMVDVPTWWGAYEKAIAGGNTDERAIALADQAVIDAQGGGQTKDLSAIERGGPAQKLFTVFYSFMNTALNLGVAQTMSASTPAARAKLAVDYAMLYVIPPVLGYFLKNAITPGDSGDDDPEKIAKKLSAAQIDYLMGLMVVVREFSDAAKTVAGANDMGRDYQGPAGLRAVADAGKLAKQTYQWEFDDAFRKAAVNMFGDLLGLPSAQINRTITGIKALHEGETDNPGAVVMGFQKPH